jgi:zinc transporter ZupT
VEFLPQKYANFTGCYGKQMTDNTILFLLPFLGACLGLVLALGLSKNQKQMQPLLLAFSGAFLISVILFELLPEVYNGSNFAAGYWIIGGILLQISLEFFSKGVEHGHAHIHGQRQYPILLWFSLSLHAFLEGIPLESYPHLAWGMFVHKIPITIALFSLLHHYSKEAWGLYIPLFLFALLTPLGGFLGANLLMEKSFLLPITSIVIGVLLHIATTIIFESSEGHRFNGAKMLSIFLGFFLGSLL